MTDDVDVDLFYGAGGASVGLAAIGLRPIGFELDADACATHRAAGHLTVRADLSSYLWPPHLRGRVRYMHGSPPCQPFSVAGDGTGEDDTRDGMPWYRVLNAADYGVPQCRERLIIVCRAEGHVRWPRRTHAEHGRAGLPPWVSMAEALGWGMTGRPFLTVAGCNTTGGFDPWGIGGSAARAAIVVERDEGRWSADARLYTGTDWKPGGDREAAQSRALDQPAPTVSGKSGGQWQLRTGTSRGDRNDDGTYTPYTRPVDEPAPVVTSRGDRWVYERPATTVACDVRVHPPGHKINGDDIAAGRTGHDRAGSNAIRVELHELAALQGFPPGYPFHGNRTSIARQIGNALPPALIAAVAAANLPDLAERAA